MPKNTIVDVPGGYQTHKGIESTIELREPTVNDYLDIGEVYRFVPAPDGNAYPMEDRDALKRYIERLIVKPADQLLLSGLPLSVGRDLRGAVLGFFRQPVPAGEPSATSDATSSGDAKDASPPTPSNG